MNRRQKMKKMKQELEYYKKQDVSVKEIKYNRRDMRIKTFAASSYWHGSLNAHCWAIDPEGFITTVKEHICSELATVLEDYISIDVVHHKNDDIYEYIGKLKVVVP